MPSQPNRFYNNPQLGAAFENLAALFEPPSGADAAGYATAAAKKAEASRLAALFTEAGNPNLDLAAFDRRGWIAVPGWTPNTGVYGVNSRAATDRRGQDITARTMAAINAADNARALATNRLDNQRSLVASLYDSLPQGHVRPALPGNIAGLFQLPEIPAEQGSPPDLTETEWKAATAERLHRTGRLTDDDLVTAILGDIPVEQVVGVSGAPEFVRRSDAPGRQPAPKSPQTIVNVGLRGIDYGDPEKGLVWARNPDGTVQLDERGAPIALPYQGGSVWTEQQAADVKAASRAEDRARYADIVTEEIDRAVKLIERNPRLTTGLGGQLTSGIGGTPARNLASLLDPIRANVGFDKLQEMRAASPTGGALGQVSDYENRIMQATLGNLEQSQSAEQLVYNLRRVRAVYEKIIHEGIKPGDPIPTGDEPAALPATNDAIDEGSIIENDAGERMILRGNKWERL